MDFIIRVLVNGLAVFITAYLLRGVTVRNFVHAILVAVVLSVINAIIKPILIILTIPITILTLGLFILVINALIIMLVDYLLSGFKVKNFWWALAFSIVLSIINAVLQWFV
ncbi:phage holin family protein [soil metagenome]